MSLNVLIVEDEPFARHELKSMLRAIDKSIMVVGECESVSSTVQWLTTNTADLIFLDIQLGDGLSFSIFNQIDVETPIIFITANDQFALQAFKVNSIDYLLKPFEKEELCRALEKFEKLQSPKKVDFQKIQTMLNKKTEIYQHRFLVQRGEQFFSIKTADIAYFEGEGRYVFLHKKGGGRFIVNYTLIELIPLLNPSDFFRLNRSFIAHFDAIDRIVSLSKSRVKVYLSPNTERDIIISTENTRSFKMWLNR